MSFVSVKICGLKEPETMEAALRHGADMIGLMWFSKSPRHVDVDSMAALADQARGRSKIVIVTVNALDAELDMLDRKVKPDWWQLHGAEDAQRIRDVQSRFGRPVMKALGVGSSDDVTKANSLIDIADRLLLDAKPPKDASRPGGLGVTFEWSLLDGLSSDKPFMLSGGLTPETVADAITATNAWGVDVSSGVESAPGHKDAQRIADFLSAAKQSVSSKIRTSA